MIPAFTMAQNLYHPASPFRPPSAPFTPQHSPPSLIYSDFSEDFEDTMNPPSHCDDANTAVQKMLGHMDQVVEHLRDKDEHDAANSIAKDTLNIVNTFNNATAPWDIDSFLMSPRTVHRPNPASSRSGPQAIVPPVGGGGSWASVAAKPAEGDNQLIKFRPSDSVVHQYVEEDSKQSDEDARVVWIKGWGSARPLATVTERVSQGPLLSMVYSEEYGAVCLIFQTPSSARELLCQDTHHQATAGVSLFGRGCNILPGLPYPEDEDIRRMSHPLNERRRLTFARSQLFANGITEDVFKNDIYHLVGEGNVELVWLFNTGNATVVFTSTAIARMVRDDFRKKARVAGPYQSIHVSFSHDPCEKPLNLITQIPSAGGEPRPRSGSTRNQPIGSGLGTCVSRRDSKRKKAVDADGWQTVRGKKR